MTPQDNMPAPSAERDAATEKRRAILKAGLASAPVLASLKAKSAFATGSTHNCIHISAFASLARANMQLSHAVGSGGVCLSHGYWKTHSCTEKAYKFLTPSNGPTVNCANFYRQWGTTNAYDGKTLQQVLDLTGGDLTALARHTVGMYLTALYYPSDAMYDSGEIKLMWESIVKGGSWNPPGSTLSLSLEQTLAYFDYVFNSTPPAPGLF